MTAEHLRVLLHNENDSNLLHKMVVKGEIPGPVSVPKAPRGSERNRGRRSSDGLWRRLLPKN